jgi:hypothetical protein
MALNKTDFWSDIAFLLLYSVLSPIAFGFFCPKENGGDGEVILLLLLIIMGTTLFISSALTYFARQEFHSKWMNLLIGLIPLIILFITFYTLFGNSDQFIKSTFFKSNTTEIAFLYTARKLFLG